MRNFVQQSRWTPFKSVSSAIPGETMTWDYMLSRRRSILRTAGSAGSNRSGNPVFGVTSDERDARPAPLQLCSFPMIGEKRVRCAGTTERLPRGFIGVMGLVGVAVRSWRLGSAVRQPVRPGLQGCRVRLAACRDGILGAKSQSWRAYDMAELPASPQAELPAPLLPLGRYRFRFLERGSEDGRSLAQAGYLGSAWRGAFGHALRRAVCVTRLPVCDSCMLLQSCIYPWLFESRTPPNAPKLSRYPRTPGPFVLEPHDSQYDGGGRTLNLGVSLFGQANDHRDRRPNCKWGA